jgi:tripartite-type tricarboxylate transporter receptor subunit TctC
MITKVAKIAIAILFSAATIASANTKTCGVVVEFPPGGSADRYARLLQKYNSDFRVEYRIGASGALAVNYAGENPEFIYFAAPSAFGKETTFKGNPPIELYKILIGSSNMVLTGKSSIDLNRLMYGEVNLGIGSFGIPQHIIAEQLKRFNPKINIIPTSGDAKALPLLINGDLDAQVMSTVTGFTWMDNYKQFKSLMTIDFNKPYIKDGLRIESVGFLGAFIHKNATPAQRQQAINCLENAISQSGWKEDLKDANANPVFIDGKEKDSILQKYIGLLRKFDL